MNNGSFNLKSPKTSLNLEHKLSFQLSPSQKWQNVTFMAGSWGWVQLPRNILKNQSFWFSTPP